MSASVPSAVIAVGGAQRQPFPHGARMRAVQITRNGGPEVLDVVDVPEPTPVEGQQPYEIPTAGINFADTRHRLPAN